MMRMWLIIVVEKDVGGRGNEKKLFDYPLVLNAVLYESRVLYFAELKLNVFQM